MVNWRKLVFGGVDSSNYGIYITGEGVYNAPTRAVEFVDVPGRNGAIALDQGHFNNITVTYPAGTFGMSQSEFRQAVSNFRNAIMSLQGYQKLEDTYHPDEYRMAVYTAGLEVSPAHYGQAGEFDIIFECKPQRWLNSGDTAVTVTSGNTLTNPTQFEAGPLLAITGYGSVTFNGYTVTLANTVLSDVLLVNSFSETTSQDKITATKTISRAFTLDSNLFNSGDTITVNASKFLSEFDSGTVHNYIKSRTGSGASEASGAIILIDNYRQDVEVRFSALSFTAGTSATKTYTYTVVFQNQDMTEIGTLAVTGTVAYAYSSGVHTLTFTVTAAKTNGSYNPPWARINAGKTTVNSSVSTLGNPTYIDCDLGEAYRLANGTPVSLNSKVVLGSQLPVLAPGSNTVTFTNTITQLKISPRWWRI